MTTRVGAYLRISSDPYGQEAGIERQREDAHAIAARQGWDVAEEYVDNDLSAFSRSTIRPAFERMLLDLRERRIDGLVFWHLDRFTRQPIELEQLIHLNADLGGISCAHHEGLLDLGSSSTQLVARISTAVASEASAATSRRTTRMHAALAKKGKPVGGARPFGWQRDKVTPESAEAEALRQAARDVVAGIGMHTIAQRWNDAGLPTPHGNRWTNTTVRRTLLNPRLAGWRTHRGEIVTRGTWEPLLSDDEHEALRATIRERGKARGRDTVRRYLLTGVVRCWSCRALMHGNVWSRNPATYYYRCPQPSGGGCGKTNVVGNRVDEQVVAAMLRVMSSERVEHEAQPWPGEEGLADVEARLDDLWTAYRAGKVKGSRAFDMIEDLDREADRLREDRAEHLRRNMKEAGPSDVDLVAAWPDLPIEQRRYLVTTHIDAVWILPSEGRGSRWNPDRVRVDWRTPS
jgi:site-specific DNA recombinase